MLPRTELFIRFPWLEDMVRMRMSSRDALYRIELCIETLACSNVAWAEATTTCTAKTKQALQRPNTHIPLAEYKTNAHVS